MERMKRVEQISDQILKYSRNELLVSLRFMDLALCKLIYRIGNIQRIATDGKYLYYNPKYIFKLYEISNTELNHSHLHSIFHCIFYHPFVDKTIERRLWDLACDIAVEGIISELEIGQLEFATSINISQELARLKSKYGKLTAERLYRKLLDSNLNDEEVQRLQNLFCFDDHFIWYIENNKEVQVATNQHRSNSSPQNSGTGQQPNGDDPESNEDDNSRNSSKGSSLQSEWQKISERIKVDLETSSKDWGDRSAGFVQNITEVNREEYDYSEFLQKFAVLGEEMQINDDEFDYIFYTYGLQLYKNVPLIEPLEYKDVKKIKEFVVAIDTSGSVQGELVKKFVTKTYNILSQRSNFFTKINIHIIQCDTIIQKDDKITTKEDFEKFIESVELREFGGTDFRPVFEYVDRLIEEGEFENLKGLIYFTDGYGVFPNKKPNYDTAFVFVDDEYGEPQIPVWAMKLVLAKDDI